MLQITEAPKSDISTIYLYLKVFEKYPNGTDKKCHTFSVFNHDYAWGKEREFIEEIDAKNPGMYSHYHIAWSNCN